MALEIRVTFRKDQEHLYKYVREHSSASGFLKDLAQREMIRDNNYLNGNSNIAIMAPQPIVHNNILHQQIDNAYTESFDFDTDDLEF